MSALIHLHNEIFSYLLVPSCSQFLDQGAGGLNVLLIRLEDRWIPCNLRILMSE